MGNNIRISRDILKMDSDWKEIQKHVVRVPRELSDACDKAVMDAMKGSDEKIKLARAQMANSIGLALID